MDQTLIGVIGSSHKPDEKRAPIDVAHLPLIEPELRARMVFQRGYGERFGVSDAEIEAQGVGGLRTTDELYESCGIVLLAKPTAEDLPSFRDGQVLWGWPHCVQGETITQCAIDKHLTLIAWEAMSLWNGDVRGLHVFHKNNELAGYCAVLHALTLQGRTGSYGKPLRAAVIEFGLTARGAVHGLRAMGVQDITCFTQRPTGDLPGTIGGVRYRRFARADERGDTVACDTGRPMAEELAAFDVVVNGIFQDTDAPLFFLRDADLPRLAPGSLVVDVSCDEGLGFEFARPTSFRAPTFEVGDRVVYYGVDHTPSWLWRASTTEISLALLPYLPTILGGRSAWKRDPVIERAIEIEGGHVRNPKILSRQHRSPLYPHERLRDPSP